MNWKQATYLKKGLLNILLALLLLVTGSYSYGHEPAVRQPFRSEAFYSKKNSIGRKAISYKKAVHLSLFNSKERSNPANLLFLRGIHNAQANIQFERTYTYYHSFKSSLLFFSLQTSADFAEDLPVS